MYNMPRNLTSSNKPQLAACISAPRELLVEVCRYRSSSFSPLTAIIERYSHLVDVQVVVIKTGQVLQTRAVEGTAPRFCGDVERFRLSETYRRYDGSAVRSRDVVDWLKPIANRQ
jgi:hypothetical protein